MGATYTPENTVTHFRLFAQNYTSFKSGSLTDLSLDGDRYGVRISNFTKYILRNKKKVKAT